MSEKAHLCPRCQLAMKDVLHEDIEVDKCERCQGVWVEHADEKTVLQIKPETFTMDELNQLRSHYEPLGKKEPVCYIPCPICKQLMQRKNWGSHSGVIVDKCRDHGTWYDKGEIEKIQEFITAGGVEYEKMRATQKSVTRLESKLTQEVSRLDRKADSIYRRARLWSLLGF